MNWTDAYPMDRVPTMDDIKAFADNPLLDALCGDLEETYKVQPKIEYSRCAGAPGWNIKYKKSGRALCTIYPGFPGEGVFTCMVSIGPKERNDAELLLPALDESVQTLYHNADDAVGSKWLMIPMISGRVLGDAKSLIALRARKK